MKRAGKIKKTDAFEIRGKGCGGNIRALWHFTPSPPGGSNATQATRAAVDSTKKKTKKKMESETGRCV